MLLPKRTKFRKQHRGRLKGVSSANTIVFGEYGIQALEPVWLTSRQIEAARRTITRATKRSGKLWIKVFPDKSVTARAEESRMGSGKGAVDYWVVVIKPGNIIFELSDTIPLEIAKRALEVASQKLPIKTKILLPAESY